MTEGKIYFDLVEKGYTYKEIAKIYNCSRCSVAGKVYRYKNREKLKMPVRKVRQILIKPKQEGQNPIYDWDIKEKRKRKKELDKCYKRADGIIQCPTRSCFGFGFDLSGNAFADKLFDGL